MVGRPVRCIPDRQRAVVRMLVVLSALLLFAQWGAVAHSHAHDAAPLTQVGHTLSCGECGGYAPLLASATESYVAFPVPIPPAGDARADIALPVTDFSPILGFRSRAPPASR
jgi:hypothetical protein